MRVMVLPGGKLRFPRTWAVAPGLEDVPYEGRDRFDDSAFAMPDFELVQAADEMRITTAVVRLTVVLRGLFCRWEVRQGGHWQLPPPIGPRKVTTSAGGMIVCITT